MMAVNNNIQQRSSHKPGVHVCNPEPAPDSIPVRPETRRAILDGCHVTVLVLSVLLIVAISYTSFKSIPFLDDSLYMNFQLVVCLVFIADFFVELWLTPRGEKHLYVRSRIAYLLLSIPYLNIIDAFSIQLSYDTLYFVRFIPLCRGGLALVIVLDYLAENRIAGLLMSYIAIMVLVIYFAGLIFFAREQPVNPGVTSYWDAFWWCVMQSTTLGCSIPAITPAAKILQFTLSMMGEIMFPIFTVYLANLIIRHRNRLKIIKNEDTSVKSYPSPISSQTSPDTKVASDGKIS